MKTILSSRIFALIAGMWLSPSTGGLEIEFAE